MRGKERTFQQREKERKKEEDLKSWDRMYVKETIECMWRNVCEVSTMCQQTILDIFDRLVNKRDKVGGQERSHQTATPE